MERDDFPSLKKERLARLTLPFVMTLDHTHLQERDLSLIFSDTSHGNLTLTGVDLAGLPLSSVKATACCAPCTSSTAPTTCAAYRCSCASGRFVCFTWGA